MCLFWASVSVFLIVLNACALPGPFESVQASVPCETQGSFWLNTHSSIKCVYTDSLGVGGEGGTDRLGSSI